MTSYFSTDACLSPARCFLARAIKTWWSPATLSYSSGSGPYAELASDSSSARRRPAGRRRTGRRRRATGSGTGPGQSRRRRRRRRGRRTSQRRGGLSTERELKGGPGTRRHCGENQRVDNPNANRLCFYIHQVHREELLQGCPQSPGLPSRSTQSPASRAHDRTGRSKGCVDSRWGGAPQLELAVAGRLELVATCACSSSSSSSNTAFCILLDRVHHPAGGPVAKLAASDLFRPAQTLTSGWLG